jgi:hypothetical protein
MARQGKHTFWHLYHLSRCVPSSIPVVRGALPNGPDRPVLRLGGLAAGTVGPWWILVPARLSRHTHRPGDVWESDEVVQLPQPAARTLRAGERGEVLCWGFLPDSRPPPPRLDTVGVGSAILERARPGRMSPKPDRHRLPGPEP